MMNVRAVVQGSRMKEGRKIDTWRFSLPDGESARFAIHLLARDNQMRFTARTDHPVFRNIAMDDTDLERLRGALEDVFRDALEAHYGTDWGPATMLEVSVRETDRKATSHLEAEQGVTISFRAVPLRVDNTQPRGNLGETRVIMRESPQTVIERGRTDRFDVDKGLDTRNMMFHRENDQDLARVVLPDRGGQVSDMERLRKALARFGEQLADNCSPEAISMQGVPAPEDLVRIMQDALSDEPEGPDVT